MNVLLISANTLTAPYPVYPLGLDYVAEAIAARHRVKIIDLNVIGGSDGIGRLIDEFKPDLVGVSIRNVDNTDTSDPQGFIGVYRELIGAVRRRTSVPVVLGGSGFTIFPAEMMRTLDADFGVIGEGERLLMLLDALDRNEDAHQLPGIITRDCRAEIPEPWQHAFNRRLAADSDHGGFYLDRGGMLNLQTKRGCNFNCIYCTYPHIEGHRLRRIPPDEVADTAISLQRAGAKYLFITDSAFNSNYDHSLAVGLAFKKAGLSIPWGAFFAPTPPPAHYYRKLADAGLTHVEFGTESLSDSVLKQYQKPFRHSHVLTAHRQALEADLFIAHYFLLGGPGESPQSVTETLDRLEHLTQTVFFFFCGMRIYPHTALYDIALAEGQINAAQDLLAPVFYQNPSISDDAIIRLVKDHANGRPNWIIGAGGDETAAIVSALYDRGHSGPLWEYLIP